MSSALGPSIRVAGDSTIDWRIALPGIAASDALQTPYQWDARDAPGISSEAGGAALLTNLLQHAVPAVEAIVAGLGQAERAARLYGAAERIRETTGVTGWWLNLEQSGREVAVASALLDEIAFETAFHTGRDMPWEQVIAEALDEQEPSS